MRNVFIGGDNTKYSRMSVYQTCILKLKKKVIVPEVVSQWLRTFIDFF